MKPMHLLVEGDATRAFPLVEDLYLIGRNPTNDIVLDSPTVSGHHARLFKSSEGWIIQDLGSRNGVVVKGRKEHEALLAEGDRVRLGEVSLLVTASPPGGVADQRETLAMASVPLPARSDRATFGMTPGLENWLEREIGQDPEPRDLDNRWARLLRTLLGAGGVFLFSVRPTSQDSRTGEEAIAFEASCEETGQQPISRSALAESLRGKAAVWAPTDLARPGASLAGLQGTALLVYPLLAGERIRALMYVTWDPACPNPLEVMDLLKQWPGWATLCLLLLWETRRMENQIREKDQGRQALSRALIRRIDAGQILGESTAVHRALALAESAAPTPYPVLLLGETGTGKELFARWIHLHSESSEGPFVAVNCAAIHAETAESELFGHARGSYTGALRDHAGLLEQASGGTLFLDEIEDLAPSLQGKLLRALQFGTIRRMGDERDRKVELRLVAAAHPRIRERLSQQAFRHDLYYRLSTFEIELPPLRERRADIPLLANHFLTDAFKKQGAAEAFSAAALQLLRAFEWPGNVRQLESAVNHLAAVSTAPVIGESSVRSLLEAGGRSLPSLHTPIRTGRYEEALRLFEQGYLEELLAECDGNVAEASRRSGVPLRTLFRMLKKYKEWEGKVLDPGQRAGGKGAP